MKRIVSGLLLLALLSGCTSAAMQKTPEDSGRDAPLTVVQESMPEDFAVRFTWWYDTDRKSIMDTQEGLLQRDLVTEGTVSVEFRPAYTQTDADAACFMKTVEALLGLVKGTSAWASLPEPNAAYE